jgi:D-alanine-D-alanine ligase
MPEKSQEGKPASIPSRRVVPWKVAVLANVKDVRLPLPAEVPPDAGADFDSMETIQGIQAALETDGHRSLFIPADRDLPYALKKYKPDICFNFAEGLGGDAREAQVPALLEMLKIPYTGSRVLTNAISLDKTLTKRIWRDRRLPVAPFQEFVTGDEPMRPEMHFPLFVKPAREGTGMGVDTKAIVTNEVELRERVHYVVRIYKQPALVEHFLPGREFTVGILGRSDSKVFSRHPEWYGDDGFHRFPIMEIGHKDDAITPGIYSKAAKSKDVGEEGAPDFLCPAPIDADLNKKLQHLAWRAHNILGALDYSRVDIRLDAEGQPRLMEINTLPGLTKDYSDLCLICNADGIAYEDFILEILHLGASRWEMLTPQEPPAESKKAVNGVKMAA